MNFEHNTSIEKWGEWVGYVSAYFLFTTMLFFALTLLNKIPDSWSYLHVMGVTLFIVFSGMIVTRLLK